MSKPESKLGPPEEQFEKLLSNVGYAVNRRRFGNNWVCEGFITCITGDGDHEIRLPSRSLGELAREGDSRGNESVGESIAHRKDVFDVFAPWFLHD